MGYFIYSDGGRYKAGFKGKAGDCVCRAISIAAEKPYKEVFERIGIIIGKPSKLKVVHKFHGFIEYMLELGFTWVPVRRIGKGSEIHLNSKELPKGRLVIHLTKHVTTMIDGVLYDTYDCIGYGTKCVYGYWVLNNNKGVNK